MIDPEPFKDFALIDVPEEESNGANVLFVDDVVIIPESFPKIRAQLEQNGFDVRTINQSELENAEAGLTCSIAIFNDETRAISSVPNRN